VASVLRRRAPLLAAVLAFVAAVLALVLVLALRAGDDAPKKAAHGEPLAYVPAGTAEVVYDVDTREPLLALAVENLAPRVTKGALTAEQVHPLLGGRAAIATGGDRAWLAFATDQPAPRPSNGAAAAQRDGVVLVASNEADLRAALATAGRPASKDARATFDKRFAGLPAGSSARIAFNPQRLLQQQAKQIAGTRWARSLTDGAAVLTVSGNDLTIPFKVTANPVGLNPQDLPIAPGAAAPQANGSAPLTIGVRNPAQTLAFARNAGLLPALDVLNELPGIVKPNLDDLGPNGTITAADPRDLGHITLRTEPPDPGDWSRKLGIINTIGDIAQRVGGSGFGIDHRNDEYDFSQDGQVVARVGVYGKVLVLSNDPKANLKAAAAAPAAPTPKGAAGALTARLRSSVLATQIPALVRDRLGDITAWARAELTGLTGELQLTVR
jgi:hypothetical protein